MQSEKSAENKNTAVIPAIGRRPERSAKPPYGATTVFPGKGLKQPARQSARAAWQQNDALAGFHAFHRNGNFIDTHA